MYPSKASKQLQGSKWHIEICLPWWDQSMTYKVCCTNKQSMGRICRQACVQEELTCITHETSQNITFIYINVLYVQYQTSELVPLSFSILQISATRVVNFNKAYFPANTTEWPNSQINLLLRHYYYSSHNKRVTNGCLQLCYVLPLSMHTIYSKYIKN